jgi:hypothetical protein
MVEDLGFLEAQVRNLKDSTDQRIALAKDKKLKADLTSLSSKLDAFRKTLTETIESKGITGEQQLRARVGRLYVYTEFSDNMPTQSVMDGEKVMKEELQQNRTKADEYFQKDLAAINQALAKAKMKPLAVIDQSTWQQQNGQAPPPVIKPSWRALVTEAMKLERK